MMAVNSAAGASDWLRDLLVELNLEPFLQKFKDELLITKYAQWTECLAFEFEAMNRYIIVFSYLFIILLL